MNADEKFDHLADMIVNVGINAQATIIRSTTARIGSEKSDRTLVTEMDTLLQHLCTGYIRWADPELPIVVEETTEWTNPMVHAGTIPRNTRSFWLLDPLDGTRYYIAGDGYWAISLGKIVDGQPERGIIVQPQLWRALKCVRGRGVWWHNYRNRTWVRHQSRTVNSAPFASDVGPTSPTAYLTEVGAVEGFFDNRLRPMPAVHAGMQVLRRKILGCWSYTYHGWDMAAVAVALKETGGVIEGLDGSPVTWDAPRLQPLIVAASRLHANRLREALQSRAA